MTIARLALKAGLIAAGALALNLAVPPYGSWAALAAALVTMAVAAALKAGAPTEIKPAAASLQS